MEYTDIGLLVPVVKVTLKKTQPNLNLKQAKKKKKECFDDDIGKKNIAKTK